MLCRVIAQQMQMTNTHQMHIEVSRTCAQREHTRRSTRTPTESELAPACDSSLCERRLLAHTFLKGLKPRPKMDKTTNEKPFNVRTGRWKSTSNFLDLLIVQTGQRNTHKNQINDLHYSQSEILRFPYKI